MMINPSNMQISKSARARLDNHSLEVFKCEVEAYLETLVSDIGSITSYETLEVLSALGCFKDCFESEAKWKRLVLLNLKIVRKNIFNLAYHPFSIFSGMAQLALVIHNLSVVVPNINPYLQTVHKLLVNNINEYIYSPDRGAPAVDRKCELICGISGSLRYLLNMNEDDELSALSVKLVNTIMEQTRTIQVRGITVPGLHYYPNTREKKYMTVKTENGYIDYNIPHGLGGPLIALAAAYRSGIRVNGVKETIELLLSEYLKAFYVVNDIMYWPGNITLEQYAGQDKIQHTRNPMSWYYGSVGILRGIYMASAAINHKETEQMAVNELLKIAKMDLSEYLLTASNVYHGYAGAAAVMNEMYHDTGNSVFGDTAMNLAELLIRHLEEGICEKDTRDVNEDDHDYLTGKLGVLQTIYSIISELPNGNEQRILIV